MLTQYNISVMLNQSDNKSVTFILSTNLICFRKRNINVYTNEKTIHKCHNLICNELVLVNYFYNFIFLILNPKCCASNL